ncbi:TsaC protein (YrdC domain) required for threonylcarbamoyladenosine t(6)A37 modification in tRNA [hydrothermal vent metagenome]|uniref:L-threonylcarbamoyladenylate synthase n=1 Tax=hydrothermal vent metagenome TaxID=652676 RepID=A0A3B0R5V2_9ZZZZ
MSAPVLSADDANSLARAAQVLLAGELVIVPTETVYGVAALAQNDAAVQRIYSGKARPATKALIAHVDGVQMAQQLAVLNDTALALIARFWPGPLTLILPKQEQAQVSALAGGGLSSIALRCPDHDFTRQLIRTLGQPLLAPSANMTGAPPPICIADIASQISKQVALIIDGGTCRSGQPSSLFDLTCTPPVLLREGAISKVELDDAQ